MLSLEDVADTFGLGVAALRGLYGPYRYHRSGPIGVVRDEGQRKEVPRVVDVVALGIGPREVEAEVDRLDLGKCCVCHVVRPDESSEVVESFYRAWGRRVRAREPLFVRDLATVQSSSHPDVWRVVDAGEAEMGAIWTRRRLVDAQTLGEDDPAIRLYLAWKEGRPVGRVRSVAGVPGARWLADLYVEPAERGRGLGRALMEVMLADDHRLGHHWSVLGASVDGARLYPRIGYEEVATLSVLGYRQ